MVEGLSPWFDERGERGLRQAQLIGQLSGLDFADSPTVKGLDPRSLRDQAFTALRGYLQALAGKGALPVLIVEDLHWADDGSLDLLQRLDGVPQKLNDLIVGRAEGNPYHMEELVRRLIDDGVIAIDGPRWTSV